MGCAMQDTPPAKCRPAEVHRPTGMSKGKAILDQSGELVSWKAAHLTNAAPISSICGENIATATATAEA